MQRALPMRSSNLMLLSVAGVAASFLAAAGCSSESSGEEPVTGEEGGVDSAFDGGGGDAGDIDASIADAKEDRRISWDSGADAGAPVVLEMWTRGAV